MGSEMCIRDRNTSGYYKAVNCLKSKEAPIIWDISNLYPGMPDNEICEIVAAFFNKISLEYTPIPNPAQNDKDIIYVQPHQVSARLKSVKKPKGLVAGDIPPELIGVCRDILAIPLAAIYNQTLNTLCWPDLWKHETHALHFFQNC